jgi:hypothetical protein
VRPCRGGPLCPPQIHYVGLMIYYLLPALYCNVSFQLGVGESPVGCNRFNGFAASLTWRNC